MIQALELSEKFIGSNTLRTAITLTNLGEAYGGLRQYENQVKILERAY